MRWHLWLAIPAAFVWATVAGRAENWGGGHAGAVKFGGWTGIVTSVVALYLTAKALINDAWGKKVLP